MSDISLSKSVRANLLSLKGTADMMATTQNRLATGNKVNSALDNPSSWFTAKGLTNRASDLNALIDAMANGVQTLKAADNGLSAMTKTLESMQSTLRQARQDKSFQTQSYAVDATAITTGITSNASAKFLELKDGAVGTTAVKVDLAKAEGTLTGGTYTAMDFDEAADTIDFKIAANGATSPTAVKIEKGTNANSLKITVGSTATDNISIGNDTSATADEMAAALTQALSAANAGVTVSNSGGKLAFNGPSTDASKAKVEMTNLVVGTTGTGGTAVSAGSFGFTAGGAGVTAGGTAGVTDVAAKTVDELVDAVNSNTSLDGKIRASNDNGKLRLENQSTQKLNLTGASTAAGLTGAAAATSEIGGNSVRAGLSTQFNELRDQLDKLADDASFNGINLLRGDKLAITFNETGTSSIDIQTTDGDTINSANLGVATTLEATDLDSDANIDAELGKLKNALNEVRSQASSFGSNLSIVENRQTFTKSMISTLEDGAGNLTLADMNTEAANLLALQTRQSLSQNSLSLASQADQSILQLIR